jgi:glycolate oxidase FAD binding subunit
MEISAADQYVTLSGKEDLLEIYKALPKGLYPPFPPVSLPGGIRGLVERGGFGQTFFFASEVLGVAFTTKAGTIYSGGLTVKNVQGYDLVRPFVGSFGSLGSLQQVTLRLRPGKDLVFMRRLGELVLPAIRPRFLWHYQGWTYAFHFGHPLEVRRFRETFGGEEVKENPDYKPMFQKGMGVGPGSLLDLRFNWANGASAPPMPEAFKRLAEVLGG